MQITDYYKMYKKRGLKKIIKYFFEAHLYDLYNINYVKTTDDLNYAINWLLRYLLTNNYDSKIIIKSYSNDTDNCIFEGVLTYDKTISVVPTVGRVFLTVVL